MASLEIGIVAGLAFGGFSLFYLLWLWIARRGRRGARPAAATPPPASAETEPDFLARLTEGRIEALEAAQAEISQRLAALDVEGPARMQEIAGSLVGLIRDKNASIETALAGIEGLRARLKTLEQLGDLGEARGLFEGLRGRLDALEAGATRAEAGTEARLAALQAGPFADITAVLDRLAAQNDATVATVLTRLAPLEARLAELEGALGRQDPREALDRLAERLEGLRASQAATEARLEELATPAENPFAEISEQLTKLYAQKDATVETVFARLAPLEARLAELEGSLGRLDPQAALDRFAERLEGVRSAQADAEARLQSRIEVLEQPEENPFAEISEQLTKLYAQKDATVETVFARLAPLEARLAELEGSLGRLDPQAALDRFAERLEGVRSAQADAEARLQSRIEELASEENPFAEISEQLTKLYAQKDATVETVFARLAPLEARLAEIERLGPRFAELEGRLATRDPQAAVAELSARLGEMERVVAATEGATAERLAAMQGAMQGAAAEAGKPYAAIAEQLARLSAHKEAVVEAVFARLAPLEARLAALETRELTEEEARAEAQAIAAQMIAARTVAEETRLFASRLTALEASLPRLSLAQSLMMQALERQAAPWPADAPSPAPPAAGTAPAPAKAPGKAAAEAPPEVWQMPRVVSVHHK